MTTMPDLNVPAVLTSALVCFIIGATYYAAMATRLTQARAKSAPDLTASNISVPEGPPKASTMVIESLRCLVLAGVVAGLAAGAGVDTWPGGLALGAALWIGFPFILWTGAVVHEKTPIQLAAIHAGDWLAKLLAIGVIVSVWR